ncbi:Rhamnulokinase [Verrucomicrobia bacterium]|nr:Rhamnulokinase [Verrucomicrobiota bacterium]
MSTFYVACDLGADKGRVMLGTLAQGELTLSEAHQFPNRPIRQKDSLLWDMPSLFEESLEGLRAIGAYDEPVESISCHSWGSDYLLFDARGSLLAPTYHPADARFREGMKSVVAKVPREVIYEETGGQPSPGSTLCQLGAEKSRRLSKADCLMPVADAFNYLLGGVSRVETSLACTTRLFNPVTEAWSERLFKALHLPREIFPPVVPGGTELGPLRPELAKRTGLAEARVIASCSHELSAALATLPAAYGETWGFLRLGPSAIVGAELDRPRISEVIRDSNFTMELGFGGSARLSTPAVGLSLVEDCRRFWGQKDREIQLDVLMHLAGSAPPFESLINPEDPRFHETSDLPLKIQAFCKETHQAVPRKPGPVIRCVLESLALLYRKRLDDFEALTGTQITRLYLMGSSVNALLTHFTANALQIPVVLAPTEAASIGNVIVQALTLGHLKSLAQGRQIVRSSFKMQTIMPHALAWNAAYGRLRQFCSN